MKSTRLYNMVFPTFMLFAFVPKIWLLSAISNFVIDSLVLVLATSIIIKKDIIAIYKKSIFKIWIIGFVSDIIATVYLTLVSTSKYIRYYESQDNIFKRICNGIYFAVNHSSYENIFGVLFILSGVLIASMLICFFNYLFAFNNIKISKKQKILISIVLAVFTAPIFFFAPNEWFIDFL